MADSIDNFFRGLEVFQQGMDKSVAREELKAANEELLNIQANARNDQQRQQAVNNLSFQLANNLAASGVDAATISQTAGRMGVSQSAMFQAQQNLSQQKQAQSFKALEAKKQRQFELRKLDLKNKQQTKDLADFEATGNFQYTKEDIKKLNRTSADARKIFSQAERVKELIGKVGTAEIFDRKSLSQLKSAMRTMQLTAKGESQFGLGVLTGPDLTLLEEITGKVGSVSGLTTFDSTVVGKVNEFIDNIQNNLRAESEARGFRISRRSNINDLYLKARVSTENRLKINQIEQKYAGNPKLVTAIKQAIANPTNPRAAQLLQRLNLDVNNLLGD